MYIGFEIITPTPDYPLGSSRSQLEGQLWNSQTKVAEAFKTGLKVSLRAAQLGQCCFCRRQLGDDYAVHFEHFIDKSSYPNYSYEIKNLALSCGTCNINKNGHFSSIETKLRKRLTYVGPAMPIVPTIKNFLFPHAPFPVERTAFRWVNPHFHEYSCHIELATAWVYRGKTPEGWRTIRGCKLNKVILIERRANQERLQRQVQGLSHEITKIYSLSKDEAYQLLKNLAATIEQIRKNGLSYSDISKI